MPISSTSICMRQDTITKHIDISNSNNRFIYIDKETGLEVSDPTKLAEMNKNATLWSTAMTHAALHSWVIEDGSF